MKKEKVLKIIIPICLILIITGIWIFKNNSDNNGETFNENQIVIHEDFILEASSIDLDALKKHKLSIIIDFGADSCIPCKEMAPVLQTLNEEMQGKAIIKFVDVWKNGDVAKDYPVQVIPTQVFFTADGNPYVPSDNIQIEFNMYSYNDSNEHAFTVHQGGLTEEQMRTILADMGVN